MWGQEFWFPEQEREEGSCNATLLACIQNPAGISGSEGNILPGFALKRAYAICEESVERHDYVSAISIHPGGQATLSIRISLADNLCAIEHTGRAVNP